MNMQEVQQALDIAAKRELCVTFYFTPSRTTKSYDGKDLVVPPDYTVTIEGRSAHHDYVANSSLTMSTRGRSETSILEAFQRALTAIPNLGAPGQPSSDQPKATE